ncbi:MAG: EFR1 family ferrodoxin [Coriobacteriia bacterium]|nr:EFR1 family ferrodoxin [Coriobacteriia bacterium]
MREHLIYFFSGTGNSLWAALNLKKALGNCDVQLMELASQQPDAARSIGFVFPCYYWGAPHLVLEFFAHLDTSKQEETYYYAVVTYGAILGSALGQTSEALNACGIQLDYATGLKSFANNVAAYDMSKRVAEKTAQAKLVLQDIAPLIVSRECAPIKKPSTLIKAYNRSSTKDFYIKDNNYQVNSSCASCLTCNRVCPVQNIQLKEGRPTWNNRCQHCLACIQWCPNRAIDYGKKTYTRGRYTHPEITTKMFIDHLGGAGVVGASSSGQ